MRQATGYVKPMIRLRRANVSLKPMKSVRLSQSAIETHQVDAFRSHYMPEAHMANAQSHQTHEAQAIYA